MATVELSVNGGAAVQLLGVQDLAQVAAAHAADVLKLLMNGNLAADLTRPLSSVGSGKSADLTVDPGSPSWTIPGLPNGDSADFTLGSSASANLKILQAGDTIFQFDVDYQGGAPKTVTVPAGKAFVDIKLLFAISGALQASAPIGSVGVTANAGGKASFAVENFKSFDANTPILDAVQTAIASFTLPLRSTTVTRLSNLDSIYYEFDGSVDVGFGVTYGLSGKVSASSVKGLSDLFSTNQQFFQVTAPTLSYGVAAGVSASFNWSRSFACFLQRNINPAAAIDGATLHLSSGSDTQRSVTLQANAGITQTTAPSLSVSQDAVLSTVLKKITNNPSIAATDWKLQAVNGVAQPAITLALSEVQKYIDDANNWLSGLFQDLQNDGGMSLAAIFASTNHFVSAFTYDFDVTNANFPAAWADAIRGHFLAVLGSEAASLDPGSGLEKLHTTSTKLTLTWFGLKKGSIASQWNQTSLKYKGGGIFALEAQAGADFSTSSNKANTSTSIYLEADADGTGSNGGLTVTGTTLALRGLLTSKGNSNQTSRLGALLHALNGGATTDAAGDSLKAISRISNPGTVVVSFSIGFGALSRIASDDYVNGTQPPPPHLRDQNNWAKFLDAADDLAQSGEPAKVLQRAFSGNNWYRQYSKWAQYDAAINGSITSTENRRGILDVFALKNAINDIPSDPDDATLFALALYWTSAQQFMNFCEDTEEAVELGAGSNVTWSALAAAIQKAGGDIDPWYGPTTILATALLVLSSAQNIATVTALGTNSSAVVTVTI